MTMKLPHTCLTAELLRQLAHDQLEPVELSDVEEHVGTCDRCRSLLEAASLDSQWLEQVLPVLKAPRERPLVTGELEDVGHEEQSLDSVLRLLGPTDDPHKLGRIGAYEVMGIIGRGGMGVVFKAFDAPLNRFVAIKVLLPHLAASGAARKRFAREGQAAAAVIDDNVMPIYSVAEWQGIPYLVTQYSRGVTLQKRIQDQGALGLKEILRIGMQTARGLAAAHAQGLVHRDVKPSNILLDGTVERALLTDFGLARAVDDASITRTGIIAGTPQYMSPEQARGGSVDARSDQFGLGCVLYAMCAGRPPFRADNSYAVLRQITDDEPRPIREINPDIPEWLSVTISRLMAKSPDARFGSAQAVADLLEKCLAHVQDPSSAALPSAIRKTLSKPSTRISWSLNKGAWLMLATLVTGALGFLFLASSDAPDISGRWRGEEWGDVTLTRSDKGELKGSFSDSVGRQPGVIELKWSRIERRFNGFWREGEDRFGELSVRLVGDEIRGAHTTDPKSRINPATPRLADLTWIRSDRVLDSERKPDGKSGTPPHAQPVNVADQLQGTWQAVAQGLNGQTRAFKWPYTLRFQGNRYEYREGANDPYSSGTIRIMRSEGRDQSIASINLTRTYLKMADPPNKQGDAPHVELAIVQVERDVLRMCSGGLKANERPGDFTTAADDGRLLMIYRRISDGPQPAADSFFPADRSSPEP